jgi:hypothetical protein
MSEYLPDVNVLLALLWPRHVHHSAAQTWFAAFGHRGWATNTITQLGVVRLLTNPAIAQGAVSGATALATLAEATRHVNHRYWPLDRPVPELLGARSADLPKYRHWTDLLLLQEAAARGGTLVTFDRGIETLPAEGAAGHLLVLKA